MLENRRKEYPITAKSVKNIFFTLNFKKKKVVLGNVGGGSEWSSTEVHARIEDAYTNLSSTVQGDRSTLFI